MSDASSIKELERVLALQKQAFLKNQNPPIDERKANIAKIPGMLIANKDAIREAINTDFGNHPTAVTDLVEILGVAGRAEFVISQLDKWIKPDDRYVDPQMYGNGKAAIRYQAKGVIGNMVPFNFPIDLSIGPLCEMLAAGNRVIIKPSEFTPATADVLARIISETFPEDLVHVVNGGLELSRKFTQMKFNHILYTGSPLVGKLVMAEAAKNLVPVTLELGGKCPVILTAESVTRENVEGIIGVKLLKNGQMCISVDYVYVPREELSAFTDHAEAYFQEKLSDYTQSKDNTGIISNRHLDRLEKLIIEARAAGTKSIILGGAAEPENERRQLPLTMFLDPSKSLGIMNEEIFGPILPIIPYDTVESVIAEINAGERPLGLYIYTDSDERAEYIINNTNSGGAAINACAMQGALPSLGFGGSGNSGMGRHHGLEGFREFSNPRGVYTRAQNRQDMVAAFAPPYAALAEPMVEAVYKQAIGA